MVNKRHFIYTRIFYKKGYQIKPFLLFAQIFYASQIKSLIKNQTF